MYVFCSNVDLWMWYFTMKIMFILRSKILTLTLNQLYKLQINFILLNIYLYSQVSSGCRINILPVYSIMSYRFCRSLSLYDMQQLVEVIACLCSKYCQTTSFQASLSTFYYTLLTVTIYFMLRVEHVKWPVHFQSRDSYRAWKTWFWCGITRPTWWLYTSYMYYSSCCVRWNIQ